MKHLHVDPQSDIPVHVQIKEQIKVALALGRLQPGDALPSIREVESATGVGRMLVRKAYQQLEEAGLVEVAHGRRTVVTGAESRDGVLARRAEALASEFTTTLEREGLEPLSFSRLFHQTLLTRDSADPRLCCVHDSRTLAHEFAVQVQGALGLPVQSCSLKALEKNPGAIAGGARVLTSYYFLEDLQALMGGTAERIVPLSFDFDPVFLERLAALPEGTEIAVVFHRAALRTEGSQAAVEALLQKPQCGHLDLQLCEIEGLGDDEALLRSPGELMLVSNAIWDDKGEFMARHPMRFWRLAVCIDRRSLEAVKAVLGIVV